MVDYNQFESILFDGHVARNEFLRAGISYALEKGWLEAGPEIRESQYTAVEYVLTEEGRKHFGLKLVSQ